MGKSRRRRERLEGSVKRCTRCGETKSLDDFSPLAAGKDRRQSWCKVCHREWAREHRLKPQVREREKAWSRDTTRALWALAAEHWEEFEALRVGMQR